MKCYIAVSQPKEDGNLSRTFARILPRERVIARVWYRGAGGSWVEKKDVVFTSRGATWQRFGTEVTRKQLFARVEHVETVAELESRMKNDPVY